MSSLSQPHPTTNNSKPPSTSASLELRQSIYQTSMKSSQTLSPANADQLASQGAAASKDHITVSYACDTCGVDCTPVRYHSLKSKNYELCPSCYLDGRFSSKMFSGDFVKLTSTSSFKHGETIAGANDWSDGETLLLLEGIEMYDDDWALISEHVGTRSREQCIAHFLQLPIEDEYISASREGDLGPLQYARLPFDRADNPVMSVVAFLASAVGPGVAAAAAQSAIHELTDGLRRKVHNDSEGPEAVADSDTGKRGGGSGNGKATTDPTTIERVAAVALGTAAAKAQALASHEESNIRSLTTQIVRAQLTKLELKMVQFDAMESLLEEERKSLEAARQQLLKERMSVMKGLESVRELMSKATNSLGDSSGPGPSSPSVQSQMASIAHGIGAPVTRASPVDVLMEGSGPPSAEAGASITSLS